MSKPLTCVHYTSLFDPSKTRVAKKMSTIGFFHRDNEPGDYTALVFAKVMEFGLQLVSISFRLSRFDLNNLVLLTGIYFSQTET